MSSRQEQVEALLERWSELAGRGQDVSAAQRCADCPEVLDELESQVGFLRRLERLVLPDVDPDETVPPRSVATPPPADQLGLDALTGAALAVPVIPNHE